MTPTTLLLVEFALKGFLILTATAGVAWGLRRSSAATLHRVWLLGMAALLASPMAGTLLPQRPVRVMPAISADSLSSGGTVPAGPWAELAIERNTVAGLTPSFASDGSQEQQGNSAPLATMSPATNRDADAPIEAAPTIVSVFSWSSLLAVTWASVATVLLARLVVHQVLLIRLLRCCSPMTDEAWVNSVAEASESLGLRRRVRLVTAATAMTPATAGTWRPTVILPACAKDWSASQRRSVLLHELAHVKRCDVLAQSLAAVVCAVHWFNPLAWCGLAQMRKLRELACDDLVLAGGQSPADYAETLLGVARAYQPTRLAMAIGMARGADVERRVLAILDAARNRMPLNRRGAILLAALAATTVVAIGAVRLDAQASAAAADSSGEKDASSKIDVPQEKQDAEPADGGETTLEVLITDDEGNPLPHAKVHVSYWEVEGGKDYPTRSFEVDESGVARVPRPRRLNILRLWPSNAGYVPEFLNFGKGTHGEGEKIPGRLHFRLARGTKLSGRIVDESGDPIAGATVEVSVNVREPAWGPDANPMVSTWLTDEDFNSPAPVTDADGRWSIDNAPVTAGGKDYDFRLKITHDDYARDSEWGQHQREQGIDTSMLRDGTATIVLKSGVSVEGTVVDLSGEPVAKGLVIWSDNPYLAEGVNETPIDGDGRFKTIPLKPGEYPITVVAPGYQPAMQKVQVAPGMKPLRLAVSPGKKLIVKIVDRQGRPIPGAYVGIDEWRGTEAIYNEKHPNVHESGIPRHADKEGVYRWDWAPGDAVSYRVSAKGYSLQNATLVAKETPHVVTLPDDRVVVGTVTDANTGEPIEKFSAIPVIVFRENFFSTWTHGAKVGRDGRYELPLEGSADPNDRYRVRFEANGYRSLLSEESFGLNDGRATLDVTLVPAPMRTGTVIDAKGRPIQSAEVLQATPTEVPHLHNNKPDSYSSRSLKTDANGAFTFRPTSEPVLIRALHEQGYAEVRREPDEEIGVLRLRPWARVEGRLVQADRPVADQLIIFSPVIDGQFGEPRFQESNQVQTDAEGRFVFERLPPVLGSIRAYLGAWEDSPLTSSESTPLDLRPGERRSVVLGGNGAIVTGKIVPTGRGDVPLDAQYSLNYLVSRDRGAPLPPGFPTLGFQPGVGERLQVAWLDDPRYQKWQATRANYFVKLSPEGSLRVNGVPAGGYDLVIQLYEQPAGCLVQTVGRKVVPVEVTEADIASGEKTLGDIEVPCRVGPRVGENMQAYKFLDSEGREHSVFDMKGKYVLLHVWASWCAPCMKAVPEMKSTIEADAKAPIVFVGLNIDADAEQAKSLVETNEWGWNHTYLGSDSDMCRQLAVSSAPAYFLIGPDGNLITSTTDWPQMKETIEASLNRKTD